ncbi:hypothetical protein [Neobacillus niacini]|uniref:hypothetical protein n=1 Tax=Neobacillus niacini TaxID=86668 RepID=UPI000A8AFD87|nr:hypothetical protein [Neobacillus niacini]
MGSGLVGKPGDLARKNDIQHVSLGFHKKGHLFGYKISIRTRKLPQPKLKGKQIPLPVLRPAVYLSVEKSLLFIFINFIENSIDLILEGICEGEHEDGQSCDRPF